MNLTLTSPAFSNDDLIPSEYTCEGGDFSPALFWQDDSNNTKSFVLIMDDPDAPNGTWDHWVLFNIPPDLRQLPEKAPLPPGATDGNNSWGQTGYRGPCPPSGSHRYVFRLYALDTRLDLTQGSSKNDLLLAMKNHIIAQTELIGHYQKKN